ncbi:glucokinase [Marinithermofilum abyssi]|uniref:Glucokinase n=1 Tax=Marinithermofilum abyssi TaxID=1571185 RepID=A0A8J2VBH1_9BACL|nr:ROK family glucokinase [Marinithermofilum abyssi]GGE04220.1 glucokinase [Marinithermofilum abyssi]
MNKRYIGIDLGGTSMKLGIVDADGQLLYQMEKPTQPEEGADQGLRRIAAYSRELAEVTRTPWEQVGGLGIGLPGFLDIPNGVVVKLTNVPWSNVPVKERLESALKIPVAIDNDANVAALGEAWSGAGAGLDDLICVTLGTGVGGGVITHGRLVHGVSGLAGEIGHIRVEENGALCGCGQRGCVETISSATGIVRLAREAEAAGRETSLAPLIHDSRLTAKDVFAAAERGDAVALEVVRKAADALARVLAILSVVNNPARFIIGGGVSKAGETLFNPLRAAYAEHALAHSAKGVEIVAAQLGNDAGIIGAAGLTADREK